MRSAPSVRAKRSDSSWLYCSEPSSRPRKLPPRSVCPDRFCERDPVACCVAPDRFWPDWRVSPDRLPAVVEVRVCPDRFWPLLGALRVCPEMFWPLCECDPVSGGVTGFHEPLFHSDQPSDVWRYTLPLAPAYTFPLPPLATPALLPLAPFAPAPFAPVLELKLPAVPLALLWCCVFTVLSAPLNVLEPQLPYWL